MSVSSIVNLGYGRKHTKRKATRLTQLIVQLLVVKNHSTRASISTFPLPLSPTRAAPFVPWCDHPNLFSSMPSSPAQLCEGGVCYASRLSAVWISVIGPAKANVVLTPNTLQCFPPIPNSTMMAATVECLWMSRCLGETAGGRSLTSERVRSRGWDRRIEWFSFLRRHLVEK